MSFDSCPMEKELMAVVRGGQWPAACDPGLLAHVEECKGCNQIALLSGVFLESRAEAAGSARLAAPGLLFWKAQLRRRNEALEHITRPILAVEIVGFAVTLVVLALVVWKWIYVPSSDFLSSAQNFAPTMRFAGNWGWTLVAAAALTLVLFGGVALYLVTTKE
jgi:hypothetical protein